MRRYLVYFMLSAVLTAASLAAINWMVDPYGIFRTQGLLASQSAKPLRVLNERVFKTVRLAREKPDAIVLGTSRADFGIDPVHPAFRGMRSANLATFDQPIRETRQMLELASGQGELKTVVIGLDFFTFNALRPLPSDFVDENFSVFRPVQLAFSVTTSLDSWKYRKQHTAQPGDCCYSNGLRFPASAASLLGHYRSNFMNSEKLYLQAKYRPAPACDYAFNSPGSRQGSTLEDLRAMIALAHVRHIDLRLFISPSHARQWETLAAAGLWGQWEGWKRELVRINAEEAMRANLAPFPLWDFSGYSSISVEAVPSAEDNTTLMRWYTDSSHYTPVVGNLVLNRIFGLREDELNMHDDFGVLLSPSSVEARIEAIRRARSVYRASHPSDLKEIEAVAQEVRRRKFCAANSD